MAYIIIIIIIKLITQPNLLVELNLTSHDAELNIKLISSDTSQVLKIY